MVSTAENTKSNLKDVRRKVYELRRGSKKFSRVPERKHEKYVRIKMTNAIEASIVFAFPVTPFSNLCGRFCSWVTLDVRSGKRGYYELFPRREELIHICIENIFTKEENASATSALLFVGSNWKKIVFYSRVKRRLSVSLFDFCVEFATSFQVNDTRAIQSLD